MANERKKRAEELFHRVAELAREERQAFLDAHCDDSKVRREVELLLEHDTTDGLDERALSADFPVAADIRRLLAGRERETLEQEAPRLGDYRIIREIGRGGMGTVFEAIQESLGRRVAVKVLPGDFALNPKRLERFRREARATARIRHSSIIPVYEVGEVEGTHYYAMEYIDGPSLAQVISGAREDSRKKKDKRDSSTSDPAYIACAVEQIATLAEGLEEAHRAGLIHRDVKPSNILVDKDGRYVLVDFGLVHDDEAETITRSGEMVGTLNYMSPEQVSRRRMDARTDVYSLGVTLYEVLTLRMPFKGGSDHAVQNAILFEEPLPPRKLNPRINHDLETILLHALEKNPDRRYSSAREFAADLRCLSRYEPIKARPQSTLRKLGLKASRHRGIVAVTLVLLAVLGGLSFLYRSQSLELREFHYEPKVRSAVMKMQLGFQINKLGSHEHGEIDYGRWHDILIPRSLFTISDFQALIRESGRDPIHEALKELEEAANDLPDRADAYYHRARGLLILARTEEALAELDRALECETGFVPALVLRAEILDKKGDVDGADAARKQVETSQLSEWGRSWLRASQASETGQWKEAVAAYDKLIRLETAGQEPYLGSSVETLLKRGAAHLETEQYRKAVEDFVVARSRWPESLEPVLLLAKAHYLKDETEATEAILLEFYRDSRFKDDVALAVALLYDSLGEDGEALAWVDRIKEIANRERNRAAFFFRMNRIDKAAEAGKKAVTLDPNDALAHMWLGLALFGQHRHEEAGDVLREAARLDPDNPWPRIFLGNNYGLIRSPDKAIAEYRAAIRLEPRNSLAHIYYAEQLRKSKKLDAALEEYRKSIELGPDRAVAHVGIGRVLGGRKEFQKALSEFRRALALDPQQEHTYHSLASILKNEGARQLDNDIELLIKDLKTGLTEAVEAGVKDPGILCVWAARCGRQLLKSPRFTESALDLLALAAETTAWQHPQIVEHFARARFSEGHEAEVIRVLEKALRLPRARVRQRRLLDRYRKKVLPKLFSYGSVDAALRSLDSKELIQEGAAWKFFKGREEPSEPLEWTAPDFDDSSWKSGPSDFGYGGKHGTGLEDMKGQTTTLYIRHRFSVPDPRLYRRFLLRISVDDGFVAYLNGREVKRFNLKSDQDWVPHDALTVAGAFQGGSRIECWLDPASMRPGDNVLAIQGVNFKVDPLDYNHEPDPRHSTDFLLSPVLRGELVPTEDRDRKLLEETHAAVAEKADAQSSSFLSYLEGRVLQRAGSFVEAVDQFDRAIAGDRLRRPEPHLRRAESLRALGKSEAAEKSVRQLLAAEFPDDRDLWNLWAALCFTDLGKTPQAMLEVFPIKPENRDRPDSYGLDVLWLLKKLANGDAIRINSGGDAYHSPDGVVWGRDRFYLSGWRLGEYDEWAAARREPIVFEGEIANTVDDPLYQTERSFLCEGLFAAHYSVPLPPGQYDVTLHFAEISFRATLAPGQPSPQERLRSRHPRQPGSRLFHVLAEGEMALIDYTPFSETVGFATADKQPFSVSVDDGILDLRFIPVTCAFNRPKVSAIVIERTISPARPPPREGLSADF